MCKCNASWVLILNSLFPITNMKGTADRWQIFSLSLVSRKHHILTGVTKQSPLKTSLIIHSLSSIIYDWSMQTTQQTELTTFQPQTSWSVVSALLNHRRAHIYMRDNLWSFCLRDFGFSTQTPSFQVNIWLFKEHNSLYSLLCLHGGNLFFLKNLVQRSVLNELL